MEITAGLIGKKVRVPARPEWGIGTVLRVQPTTAGGAAAHRVSIQFPTGHRHLVVPPARLEPPDEEQPTRAAGWIDTLGGATLDDRLRALPEHVRDFLGTASQRIVAISALFRYTEDDKSLLRWARDQTGIADPLTHWSRDELRSAFDNFVRSRDRLLRETVARVRQTGGPEAWKDVLATVEDRDVAARLQQAIAYR